MSAAIDVAVQNVSRLKQVPDSELMTGWIRDAMSLARPDNSSSFEMAVRIVDEDESQALNRQYRGADKPTNVLAFPSGSDEFASIGTGGEPSPLGDLVICGPLVLREAAEQNKDPQHHWHHLLVHGTLHLLGYDHEIEQQAIEMESLEARILGACGIDNPYGES